MFKTLFLIGILFFSLTGCENSSKNSLKPTQSLKLNIHVEPPTLDPRKGHDTSSISVIKMCFEGLLRKGIDSKVEPAIAYKFDILDDQKTYIFYLRDCQWWDGKPVLATDFEKSWKTILSPSFPSAFANDLFVLKNAKKAKENALSIDQIGVSCIDEKTLKVELETPIPYFLELLCSGSFLATPQHIVNQYPKWADEVSPLLVGNGPFKFKSWKHNYQIDLEKNPLYWDKEVVRLEEIELCIIEDENTELNMFESNQLDWAGSPLSILPSDALNTLYRQKRLNVYPIAGVYYYIFNTQEPPFDNVNLRKAFTLAINRQNIITHITQSEQLPALGYVPPPIWEIKKNYFKDADIEEAKRLFQLALQEMNLTIDELPQITLSYNTSSKHHVIAQAIQDQWFRAFGIRVRLENKEWKVFLDELAHRQFQIARMGGVANFTDPFSFLDLYRHEISASNYPGWKNQNFTDTLQKAELTTDIIERERLLRQAEEIFINDMPIAPIYFYTNSYLKKTYIKGVYLSELSEMDLKYAYIEKK